MEPKLVEQVPTEGQPDIEDAHANDNTVVHKNPGQRPGWMDRPLNLRSPVTIGGPKAKHVPTVPRSSPKAGLSGSSEEPKNAPGNKPKVAAIAPLESGESSSDVGTLAEDDWTKTGKDAGANVQNKEMVTITRTEYVGLLTDIQTLKDAYMVLSADVEELKSQSNKKTKKLKKSHGRGEEVPESASGSVFVAGSSQAGANAEKELTVGKVSAKPKQKRKRSQNSEESDTKPEASKEINIKNTSTPKRYGNGAAYVRKPR